MQIYPINNSISPIYGINRVNKNTNIRPNTTIKNDNVTFGSYTYLIRSCTFENVKDFADADKRFGKMLNCIAEDGNFRKEKEFYTIRYIYNNHGLLELLKKLKIPGISEELRPITGKEGDSFILATRDNIPIFSVFNFGKHGLFGNKNNLQDIRLSFYDTREKPDAVLEYYTDSKLNPFLFRRLYANKTTTGFYPSNGAKKVETTCFGSTSQETTFYNEDGSKPFWKNFIRGGVSVPEY